MNRALQKRVHAADAAPLALGQTLSRFAPAFVIAAILGLAVFVTVGEWRDGTLGVQRVVDVRSLVFEPREDGTLAVHVTRPDGKAQRVDLPSSSEGFVATMAKSLARERRRFDVTPTLPYQLSKFENGALMLKDPVIGTEVRLEAFGPTNVGAFAALM
jgi:putative photosynthetic complex assembly protein